MAYTPELNLESSHTLRRIAWALNVLMTKAIERVYAQLPRILDRQMLVRRRRTIRGIASARFLENLF